MERGGPGRTEMSISLSHSREGTEHRRQLGEGRFGLLFPGVAAVYGPHVPAGLGGEMCFQHNPGMLCWKEQAESRSLQTPGWSLPHVRGIAGCRKEPLHEPQS